MDILSRRSFTRLALTAPIAAGMLPSFAQVGGTTGKLLVGYPAGGTLDTAARQLTEAWRKQGRQYIVDNRAGAAGRIANGQLKREKADGSVLLCTHASALTIYPHVYARLYRGSAPAMQDLIGGQIPAYFGFVADFLPYLQTGKIRLLGVAAEKRSVFMLVVPTFAEQGFASIRGGETYGVFAPPGAPEASIKSLHESIFAASRQPALLAAFEPVGLEPYTLAPVDYGKQLQRERECWAPVVRASGFRSEE